MRNFYRTMAVSAALAGATAATHAALVDGQLAVLRMGDGSIALGNATTAQPIYIDVYDLGLGTVTSHPIGSAGAAAATLGWSGSHDGHLSLSSNGQYLLFGAYRADAGSADPVAQSAAVVNRVIGRVDLSNWSIDTGTALTDSYNNTEMTAVVSDDGQRFWTAGSSSGDATAGTPDSGGLRYVTSVGSSTSVNIGQTQFAGGSLEPDSMRSARIVDGQLYITTASQGSYANRGLYRTATPLPTSGPRAVVGLMNNNEGNSLSSDQELTPDDTGKYVPKTDALLLDLNPLVPGFDTAYGTGGKAEYSKWSLIDDGTGDYSWKQVQIVKLSGAEDINALEYLIGTAGEVDLFATTDDGIYRFEDSTGYVGTQPTVDVGFISASAPAYFIAAPANTKFRGIEALATVPEPALMGLAGVAVMFLGRRRK
jgi:hypothetical protein